MPKQFPHALLPGLHSAVLRRAEFGCIHDLQRKDFACQIQRQAAGSMTFDGVRLFAWTTAWARAFAVAEDASCSVNH
jgi:hypothetical protein